ncbi:MAG: SCP2 sterol-binding domain-containing protein [Chloracidobacterium sp.]|uniref:SCP2 sterol-binding domain-containing protein n=1 Tax=Chloracidobacterium validum TaxID=2821543 RepID=A0ABX8BCZ2_9BACT|nr:SCP2 sterol-binding domain-containing protein [Chloracidobacterium validum]QUW04561.1 SCP2 sterol-binding domain-containing protein [Chloracidobacterium validum]
MPAKPTSPIAAIFNGLEKTYRAGAYAKPTTFYFSLDDEKWTVTLDATACQVTKGKVTDQADVVLKTSAELFLQMWRGEYKPGAGDFFAGRIKSNDPQALKAFIAAFSKS